MVWLSGWVRARRLAWILVAVVAVVVTDLGARTLATNDEARFPLIAQDILARGDWLHPMINGNPYYNKPPLQAWLIAAASWLGGAVTPVSAVLPSALAAIAATLMVWGLGRALFGTDAARGGALAFMTMQGVFLHARLPLPDMLLTALIVASLWTYVVALRRGGLYWPLFYALVGAAFWAKGPAGLLPLGVVAVDGALKFGRAGWRMIRLPQGLLVVLAVIAPWFILGLASNRMALTDALIFDQLLWFIPPQLTSAALLAPFQNTATILFPWVLVVPFVAAQALRAARGRGTERDHVRFLLAWTLVILAVVALSRQQRVRYYLPLAAPVALLIGWWYAGAVVKHRAMSRVRWWWYAALPTVIAALTLVVSGARPRWRAEVRLLLPGSTVEVLLLSLALGLVVAGLLGGIRLQRLGPGFAVAWVGAALLLIGGYHWALVRRNAAHDYARIYAAARPVLSDLDEVRAWGVPALPLALYFQRAVTPLDPKQALPAVEPGHASTVTVARAALLEHSQAPGLVVIGRDRLGADNVAIVRQVSATASGGGD